MIFGLRERTGTQQKECLVAWNLGACHVIALHRLSVDILVPVASSILLASSCPSASPVDVPKLIDIQGYGKLWKATATSPDTFGFSVRPAAICQTGTTNCPARYADTAFIDFRIPARTTFEVIADGRTLTEVGQAAPVGDYQYRRVALDDGSGATVAWRIAVSVPSMVGNPPAPREWCGPTRFTVEIVNLSANATPPRSAPLTVLLHWGMCPVTGGPMFWAGNRKAGHAKANVAATAGRRVSRWLGRPVIRCL